MFIANQYSSKILKPGKEPFNFPATHISAQFTSILSWWRSSVRTMWRYQFNAVKHQSCSKPIAVKCLVTNQFLGLSSTKELSSVSCTRVTSCGLALSTHMATGRTERSATAMIFEPLPRLVFPTPGPLFLPAQMCRR